MSPIDLIELSFKRTFKYVNEALRNIVNLLLLSIICSNDKNCYTFQSKKDLSTIIEVLNLDMHYKTLKAQMRIKKTTQN